MNAYTKIRAALEMATGGRPSNIAAAQAALAALAKLERAAAEPVGYVTPTIYRMLTSDDPIDRSAAGRYAILFASNDRADTSTMPLYAAPPAPAAEIREVVVTDEMCDRAYIGKWRGVPELIGHEPDDEDRQWSREWLEAWRTELGPALGLVELKEPTPEECTDMAEWFKSECAACCINPQESADYGRAIFDAVKIVMWPKEGL